MGILGKLFGGKKEEETTTVVTAESTSGNDSPAPVAEVVGTLNLSKKSSLNLSKAKKDNNIKNIKISCGWKGNNFGSNLDVDLSALGYREDGQVDNITYYRAKTGLKGITSLGDKLNGGEEVLEVALDQINSSVAKVAFVINIFGAIGRGQNLGNLKNAFVKVYLDEKEYAVFNADDYPSNGLGLLMGYLVKTESGWNFQAEGQALRIEGLSDIRNNIGELTKLFM